MSPTTTKPDAWWKRAKCRGLPVERFVPDGPGGSLDRTIAICWGTLDGIECPVRVECLEAGETNGELGVWGGEVRSTKDQYRNSHTKEDTVRVVIRLQDGRLKKA